MPVVDRGFLLLQGDPLNALFRDAILQQFGVQLPTSLVASHQDDHALLWMTPKEWLVELPAADALVVQASLAAWLGQTLAAVTDVSDSFAVFDLDGEHAAGILMTGCSVDLRPHAFAGGKVIRTIVADMQAIIWKPEISRLFRPEKSPVFKPAQSQPFRCLVDRSFADHFCNWVAESRAGW
jgi:sarcosine oxidase, subunit gamma